VCAQFVELCRGSGPVQSGAGRVHGSKFKAVNNRDKNFTPHKLKARQQQLEQSVARYLAELDRADREPSLVPEERIRMRDKASARKVMASNINLERPAELRVYTRQLQHVG
jgi:hypothetical protein